MSKPAGKSGFGRVYQDVTRDKNLSIAAKGLYAYLSSLCGMSEECFPSVEVIVAEMKISKDTFYRYIRELIAAGVVEKRQEISSNGRFGHVVYRIVHKATEVSVNGDLPYTKNTDTVNSYTRDKETKSNSLKSNINYTKIFEMYNDICTSFPRLTKFSDRRRKAIKARFQSGYTENDFERLFEMAQASSFLKGENDRNWFATFDWMIQDSNMAKILDGNYKDRKQKRKEITDEQSTSSARLW